MSASNVDVVIVGAGAAGLGAARAAGALGLGFTVVEAMDRIGGRAHTESTTFGHPFDLGCHWLHSADVNPFTEIADSYGIRYDSGRPPSKAHLGDRWATDAESAEITAFVAESWARLERAGTEGRDVSAAEVVDRGHRWIAPFRTAVGGEWSAALEDVSTLDDAAYRDTDNNWPVIDGYGALVARHAKGIPVTLGNPVRRIEWDGDGVRVETAQGVISCRAVIVTASTKVIQDGVIEFSPELPLWKREAYDAVRLGNANKVAFQIDGRLLGVDDYTSVWVKMGEDQGMWFQMRPFGRDLASGFLAGPLGAELERAGPAAMLAAGREALAKVYGSEILSHIGASTCSAWQSEPWVRGAYGAALPGQAHRRKDLATPIDGKLFFAGEAVSLDFFSTAHGAHLTGIAAAEAVAAAGVGDPRLGVGVQESGVGDV